MIKKEYPLSDLTGKIIGCTMEVHQVLGNGFQEVIYPRALALEMGNQGLEFSRENVMEIYYKGTCVDSVEPIFCGWKSYGGNKGCY